MAAAAVMLAACSSTENNGPAALELVSGSGQSGPAGAVLSEAIVVRVRNAAGSPVAGAEVVFIDVGSSAPAGRDTSDAQGEAQISWRLPSTAGTQGLRAEVDGAAPLVIQAEAIEPCIYDHPYTFGTSVNGLLTAEDCVESSAFIDFYGFVFPANAVIGSFRAAASFNAFMQVEDLDRNILAFSDNEGAGSTHANARVFLRPGQQYRMGPTSLFAGIQGPYTASSSVLSSEVTGCLEVWLTRGTTTTQTIQQTDCVNSGFLTDDFMMVLMPGQSATITQRSATVDSYLLVVDFFDEQVIEDDSSGGGLDARITLPAPVNGFKLYLVAPGTSAAGDTGPYVLSVEPGPGTAAPAMLTDAQRGARVQQLNRQRRELPRLRQLGALRRSAGSPE